MKRATLFTTAIISGLLALGAVLRHQAPGESSDPNIRPDRAGSALLAPAWEAIANYHRDEPRVPSVLRVVYFHPQDRDPLPNYAARMDRVLSDVSAFYRDGLQRFGIESNGVPYEQKDGHLVLHLVRGRRPASAYSYATGDEIEEEIREALRDQFDVRRKYVLAIHALCHREADGRYVFHAPYYGTRGLGSGFSHAADCELLDPRRLTDNDKIVLTEHYYPRLELSVGQFNTKYLGGLAHELGHALGLFHDHGMPEERANGQSLMSNGNLFYRNGVHGGQRSAYLSRTEALSLISHPLITRSDRARWQSPGNALQNTKLITDGRVLHAKGRIVSHIPAYAVVGYAWKEGTDEHFARPYPVAVGTDGLFDLPLTDLEPTAYHLRLTSLHMNGTSAVSNHVFGHDAEGVPVVPWVVSEAERAVLANEKTATLLLSEAALAKASPSDRRLLKLLRDVIAPPELIDLNSIADNQAQLSDCQWAAAEVGWGRVARNHYGFDDKAKNAGAFLRLGGEVIEKGLYAHSPARYVFELNGKWNTFTARIGLHDGAQVQGSARFRVLGDGKELFASEVLHTSTNRRVEVSVKGVRQLELLTEGGEGHNHNSWALWAEPTVRR